MEMRAYWGRTIPKFLDNKLRDRQNWLPHVDVVCLGSDDVTYFVQFEDGTAEWVGLTTSLEKDLKEAESSVQVIALGSNDSYFCLWKDGSSCLAGTPWCLHNSLIAREKFSTTGVSKVNLGPKEEEYFVLFDDGEWQYGGCTDSWHRTNDEIHKKGGDMYDIQFGHDDSWLIRYSE